MNILDKIIEFKKTEVARNKQLEKEQDAAYEKRKAALDVYLKK